MYIYCLTITCILSLCFWNFFEMADKNNYITYLQDIERKNRILNNEKFSTISSIRFKDFSFKKEKKNEFPREIVEEKDKAIATPRFKDLKVDFSRPPNKSRINLYTLYKEKDRESSLSLYSILAKLIKKLYVDTDFFNFPVDENFSYQVLDAILSEEGQFIKLAHVSGGERLGSLVFPNKDIAKAINLMLKGSKKAPSLLNYVDCIEEDKTNKRINFLFVATDILEIICKENKGLIKELEALRSEYIEEIKKIKDLFEKKLFNEGSNLKTATDFKLEIAERVKKVLYHHNALNVIDKHIFDFSLGKPGRIIFSRDFSTGRVYRWALNNKE